MVIKKKKFVSSSHVVGPIDSMLRGVLGLTILLSSFAFHLTIYKMTILFGFTFYLWVTGLTNWDPFYYVVYKIWRHLKIEADINGRF